MVAPIAEAEIEIGPNKLSQGNIIEVYGPYPALDIQAIIDGITDASASNPYVIKLGPGEYDLGTDNIVMKSYVSIQGSGQEATKIKSATSTGTGDATSAVIAGANNATIADLTVENFGGSASSYGVYNNSASPRIERVTAIAKGGTSFSIGIYNTVSSTTVMTEVIAEGVWRRGQLGCS